MNWPKRLDCYITYIKLERLASDKQANLLGVFVSCEENEVL